MSPFTLGLILPLVLVAPIRLLIYFNVHRHLHRSNKIYLFGLVHCGCTDRRFTSTRSRTEVPNDNCHTKVCLCFLVRLISHSTYALCIKCIKAEGLTSTFFFLDFMVCLFSYQLSHHKNQLLTTDSGKEGDKNIHWLIMLVKKKIRLNAISSENLSAKI